MPIDVVANGKLTLASLKDRKKFPKRKKKPFASTVLGGIRVEDVEIDCRPVVPESTACDCRATRVTLEVECCVGLNRRKIQRGYFDPLLKTGEDGVVEEDEDTKVKRVRPPRPNLIKLDEDNVLVHECSHCDDIATAVAAAVEKKLRKTAREDRRAPRGARQLTKVCLCNDPQKCKSSLTNQINDIVKALGNRAYRKLLREAASHKRSSITETDARDLQAADLLRRVKKLDEVVELKKRPKRTSIDSARTKRLKDEALAFAVEELFGDDDQGRR